MIKVNSNYNQYLFISLLTKLLSLEKLLEVEMCSHKYPFFRFDSQKGYINAGSWLLSPHSLPTLVLLFFLLYVNVICKNWYCILFPQVLVKINFLHGYWSFAFFASELLKEWSASDVCVFNYIHLATYSFVTKITIKLYFRTSSISYMACYLVSHLCCFLPYRKLNFLIVVIVFSAHEITTERFL